MWFGGLSFQALHATKDDCRGTTTTAVAFLLAIQGMRIADLAMQSAMQPKMKLLSFKIFTLRPLHRYASLNSINQKGYKYVYCGKRETVVI